MKKGFQIAIDGPVAAGKSTVAQKVAERLGWLYIDTGAMYRSVALAALQRGLSWSDEGAITGLMKEVDIGFEVPKQRKNDGRKVIVLLNGKDLSDDIRDSEIGEGASVVGQYAQVRKELVRKQRQMSDSGYVIMEGRDIGTRVLPKADLKIYMDANLDERVARRLRQLARQGQKLSKNEVRQDVITRDTREMTRKVDPLRPAQGAWILDTTELNVDEVVDKICERVASIRSNG